MEKVRSSASVAFAALLLVSACGSSAATQPPSGGGGGGTTATERPTSTEAPAPTTSGSTDNSGSSGGTGGTGGGASGADAEAVAKQLVPPHSTEIQKTTAQDTWFAVYESTGSIDSLRSFYESAIPRAGLKIISTTTVSGGVSFAMAIDEAASFGGAVNIYPSSGGKTAVQVAVGKT